MEAITKYRADDGSEWHNTEQALERDALIVEVNEVMSALPPTPTELNWEGYIQHDDAVLQECKKRLFAIADREGVLKWWIDGQRNDHGKTDEELIKCHPSWFGRMLDGGHRPLEAAYSRLCCIDNQSREWNQPYFANNPPADAQPYTPQLEPKQ